MNLKGKTIRAFLWVSSAKGFSQASSWLVTLILARLLLPADFGLLAIAWVFIGLLDLINELGIGAAIIQKQDLNEQDLHSTFWFIIVTSSLLYLLSYLLAPTIARFFQNEQLTPILRVLALILVIGAFKIIPLNLLTKELDFPKRSTAEFLSVFTGGLFSVVLATLGHGVWSLVFGTLLRHTILTILVFWLSPWRPKLVFQFKRIKRILSFGVTVAGSSVVWYFYSNSDSVIIGKLLGDKLLGYYSIALNLSNAPIGKLMNIINQVLFPVFSKLQNDMENLQLYFLKITRLVSLVTFPAMVGLFLVAESFILVVLTDKWLPMLVPLRMLCLVAMIKSISQIIPTLLYARGKAKLVLKYNFACLFIVPISIGFGSQFGINGVALAMLIVYPLLSLYYFWYGLVELDIRVFSYLANLIPATVATAFMAFIVVGLQYSSRLFLKNNVCFTLIGSCVIGAIAYLSFLAVCHRSILNEVAGIFTSLKMRRLEDQPV